MGRIVLLLLTLLIVANARKNFRTGELPIGFDDFTVSEENGEHQPVQILTMLTPTFVESSERVKARKEKEDEEELARVLAWEQKQIRELQERRERMRRERKAEIERVMRERAEERKRMEAARAERRQRRMLEEQKKQQEERLEKERQAKLAAELEQQKQKEIERLREENRRQILKREEERRMWREEQNRRKEEEKIRKKKEEEEERRRIAEEEENRRREEELEKRRQEEEKMRRMKEDEERRRRKEEEERKQEEEELERKIKVKEEMQRRRLIEEKMRMEEEEKHREQEERHRKVVEEERRNPKKEFQRREQEKAQREFKAQQEKQRRRRIEVDDLRGETDPSQAEEHFETDRMRKGDRLEVKRIESQPTDSLSKRRRQELMARFGSQARSEGSNEKQDGNLEYESYETNDRQENDLNSSADNEEQDTWKTRGSQPSEPEPENTVEEEINDTVEPRKTLVRKTIQRRLRGIKTFSETKPGETLVKPATTEASYLGGWKESIEKDTEEKAEAVNQAHMMNSTTTGISTGFTPTVYTVYNSPSGTDPVVVQPVLTPNSGEQQFSGSNTELNNHQVTGQTTEDEYLRAYYEQYYKEWYRQHNEAARTTPAPVVAVTEAVVPRRQIQIKMGSQWGTPEASSPQTTLQSAQPLMPSPLINIPTPAAGATLSREQLDKICGEIQKTSRSFGINNPKTFALNNCPLVQMYYKHVTCDQINHVLEYCQQNSFFV